MGTPQPQPYHCYFMISPAVADAPAGLIDANGIPMFYVKFGDGAWDGTRYTTHNPSFEPGRTMTTANIPGADGNDGTRFYRVPNGGLVNPGTYLKQRVLSRFDPAIPPAPGQNQPGSEWYKVHGQANQGQQLAAALKAISDAMDDHNNNFGLQAAVQAWNNGAGNVQAQQQAATSVLASFVDGNFFNPNFSGCIPLLQNFN